MELRADNVGFGFGQFEILSQVSFSLTDHSRLGIVGINGAGKSTLLRMIAGELEPDTGSIYISRGPSVGMLHQNAGLSVENTIYNEMLTAFRDTLQLQQKMQQIEEQLTAGENSDLLAEYNTLQTAFEAADGYAIDTKIRMVLFGMQFYEEDFNKEIYKLSGGEKTRLALAKLLLTDPDILLLDEPTNHLDLKTLDWLEHYLKDYRGCIVAVSHDRYFLDEVATEILQLRNTKASLYVGNYTRYKLLAQEELLSKQRSYQKQQEEIAKLTDYIAKNKVRASTAKMAHSREKMLDRIEVMEKPTEERQQIWFRFPYDRDPYEVVLQVEDINVTVENRNLIEHMNLEVRRGDKCCIVGENGIGKSTFLKMLRGKIPARGGKIHWGGMTRVSYFEQEGNPFLPHQTVLEALHSKYPHMTELELRKHLATYEFVGEEIEKLVSELSGGELAKLKFANITLQKPNVLVLDEPTNHLDLYAKEQLQKCLKEYKGTVIMVSHDRYLLNDTADYIVELANKSATRFDGNFENYRQKALEEKQELAVEQRESVKQEKQTNYRATKEDRRAAAAARAALAKVEKQIEQLEQEQAQLEQYLSDVQFCSDYQQLSQAGQRLEEVKEQLDILMDQWEQLAE